MPLVPEGQAVSSNRLSGNQLVVTRQRKGEYYVEF